MIDFNNASFFKLNMVGNDVFHSHIAPILTDDEEILSSYKGIRDGVVFTTKRIIAINVQGITGKKRISHPCRIAKFRFILWKQAVYSTSTASWSFGSQVLVK